MVKNVRERISRLDKENICSYNLLIELGGETSKRVKISDT